MPSNELSRLLRTADVVRLTGLSRVGIWRGVKSGEFPAPVKIGERAIAWREHDVAAWIAALPTVSYAPTHDAAA
jgi:prophage regulatory protein